MHSQSRIGTGGVHDGTAQVARAAQQVSEGVDFGGIEYGAFDAQLLQRNGGVREIGEANRRFAVADITNRFLGIGETGFEFGAIRMRN